MYSFLEHQTPYFRSYLGRYLKQKRSRLGKTAHEIADQIGSSDSRYRSLEAGRAKVQMETFEKLFSILDLDFGDLIELHKISKIAHANDIAQELSENYPS